MNKKLWPVAALVALGLVGCAQPSAGESTASDSLAPSDSRLGEVMQDKKVQVCTTGDYRPYAYKDPDTGEWSGIDVDLAKNFAESLDADVEFVQTSWADVVPDLKEHCDVAVGGISYTTDRAQQVAFTEPTAPDGKTPIVRCGEEDRYATVEDINKPSVRVITPLGGTNERFADKPFDHFDKGYLVPQGDTVWEEYVDNWLDIVSQDGTKAAAEKKWYG